MNIYLSDPEVTEFVTNPSPNQGTKIEKPRNTQTKTKFRHPQQNRGRKNKGNGDGEGSRVANVSPNVANTGHSTLIPYQKQPKKEQSSEGVKRGGSDKNGGDVSKEKMNIKDAPPEETQRGAWTIAWEAHVYFSGTLFVLLAAYCFVNIARLHTFSRLFRYALSKVFKIYIYIKCVTILIVLSFTIH